MYDLLDDDGFPISFAFISKQIASQAIDSAVKTKLNLRLDFLDKITIDFVYTIQDRTSPPVQNTVVSYIHSAIKKSIKNYYIKV